jgi:hypothetical protein
MKPRSAGFARELVSMKGFGKGTSFTVPKGREILPASAAKVGSFRLPGKLSLFSPAVYLVCLGAPLLFPCAQFSHAQNSTYERTFLQSKVVVERALKGIQSVMTGRLPVLEGFAIAGSHPLDHYQRAYYQSLVEVSSTANGGSRVRVSTKVTAWYTDPSPSRSGYQLLTSNGRLETDLLDQLEEQLAKSGDGGESNWTVSTARQQRANPSTGTEPAIPSAPMPSISDSGNAFSSSLGRNLPAPQPAGSRAEQARSTDPSPTNLNAEAESLEEILKNQSHPNNLVAVKKSGTPVVATPSLTAKTLFLASEHDEFEMLDYNVDWVHVRISGLSRGWIWRTSLEMPGDIPDVDPRTAAPLPPASDLFHVTREETAPFPGDWEPLSGKTVRIITVQPTSESAKDGGPQVKLAFAKSLLDKSYGQAPQKSPDLAGIVLIFDSSDGGMLAATLSALRQWKAGALSDSALWHRCYFDPPETFGSSGPSASQ